MSSSPVGEFGSSATMRRSSSRLSNAQGQRRVSYAYYYRINHSSSASAPQRHPTPKSAPVHNSCVLVSHCCFPPSYGRGKHRVLKPATEQEKGWVNADECGKLSNNTECTARDGWNVTTDCPGLFCKSWLSEGFCQHSISFFKTIIFLRLTFPPSLSLQPQYLPSCYAITILPLLGYRLPAPCALIKIQCQTVVHRQTNTGDQALSKNKPVTRGYSICHERYNTLGRSKVVCNSKSASLAKRSRRDADVEDIGEFKEDAAGRSKPKKTQDSKSDGSISSTANQAGDLKTLVHQRARTRASKF